MNQKETFKEIPTTIQKCEDSYRILYNIDDFTGYCDYKVFKMSGNTKPISQTIHLLTSVDMGDIIEYVHKKTPLCSDNFSEVQMTIREDSRRRLMEFLHSPT